MFTYSSRSYFKLSPQYKALKLDKLTYSRLRLFSPYWQITKFFDFFNPLWYEFRSHM